MPDIYPVKTYNEDLDRIIGGFYPGELTFICGGNHFGDDQAMFVHSLVKMITFGSGLKGILFTNYDSPYTVLSGFIHSFSGLRESDSDKILKKAITKQVYDLPLIIKFSNSDLYIKDFCNEVRYYFKYKGIKIIYMARYLRNLMEDNQIGICQSVEDSVLLFKKLKRLAQELNIPIIITYEITADILFISKRLTEILNVPSTILNLGRSQHNSDYSFYQTPLSVMKTHDGKLGKFLLNNYTDVVPFF